MKNIFRKFWKHLGKTTSNGTNKDSEKTGCRNIEDSSNNSSTRLTDIMNNQKLLKMKNKNEEAEVMEAQLYQWLATEKVGDYSYEDRIESRGEENYMLFTDGSRVNVNLIGEVVKKVDSEDDGYIIVEEKINDVTVTKGADGKEYEIPGIDHGKVIKKKVPKPTNNKPAAKKVVATPKVEIDPVINLLEKSKKEKHTYDVELNVDAISKDLFSVVRDTFDEGEEKTLDYIVSLIDIEKLKDQLKEKLKEVYNE